MLYPALGGVDQDHAGNIANTVGGTLVPPPVNVGEVQKDFGHTKTFSGVADLLETFNAGIRVRTVASRSDVRKALRYGNHLARKRTFLSCGRW